MIKVSTLGHMLMVNDQDDAEHDQSFEDIGAHREGDQARADTGESSCEEIFENVSNEDFKVNIMRTRTW